MDLLLFNIINNFALKFDILDLFFIFSAKYLGYILIILLALYSIKKNHKSLFFLSVLSGFISRYLVVEIVRSFFHKTRPFVENNVNLLFYHEPTFSFPSGHTSFFFAFSTIIFLYNKKIGILFYMASFLIGFSRIASGVHWPLDILGGIIIGIVVGFILFYLFKKASSSFNLQSLKIFKKIKIGPNKNNPSYQDYFNQEETDYDN